MSTQNKQLAEDSKDVNVGGNGIGCFFVIIGLGILFNFGRVLDLIELWIRTCR